MARLADPPPQTPPRNGDAVRHAFDLYRECLFEAPPCDGLAEWRVERLMDQFFSSWRRG